MVKLMMGDLVRQGEGLDLWRLERVDNDEAAVLMHERESRRRHSLAVDHLYPELHGKARKVLHGISA